MITHAVLHVICLAGKLTRNHAKKGFLFWSSIHFQGDVVWLVNHLCFKQSSLFGRHMYMCVCVSMLISANSEIACSLEEQTCRMNLWVLSLTHSELGRICRPSCSPSLLFRLCLGVRPWLLLLLLELLLQLADSSSATTALARLSLFSPTRVKIKTNIKGPLLLHCSSLGSVLVLHSRH